MKVEEGLAEAMAARVADVHAPSTMGGSVRRRHRRHVIRFRVAGAALVTAALAAGAPVVLSMSSGSSDAAQAPTTAKIVTEVTVPDLTDMTLAEAQAALRAVGLVGEKLTGHEHVFDQEPKPGTEVSTSSTVKLYLVAERPQTLGDLGDGRTFGGITLGYLPEGLVWSKWSNKWSGKKARGGTSYTTSYDTPDGRPGRYGIQVMVHEGKAGRQVEARLKRDGVELVDLGGRQAYVANVGEGGEVGKPGTQQGREPSTPTIGFKVRDDLAVEVMMSPDRAEKLGAEAVSTELKKIAEGIRAAE
ncbi:PASTA domain-containing protein [Nonomuraea dietziae]|uniref:PASTA domain-containing protein n=1 Tax=Nonomuraea dietziae TaxID=65515 RepID=UPI00343A7D8B